MFLRQVAFHLHEGCEEEERFFEEDTATSAEDEAVEDKVRGVMMG